VRTSDTASETTFAHSSQAEVRGGGGGGGGDIKEAAVSSAVVSAVCSVSGEGGVGQEGGVISAADALVPAAGVMLRGVERGGGRGGEGHVGEDETAMESDTRQPAHRVGGGGGGVELDEEIKGSRVDKGIMDSHSDADMNPPPKGLQVDNEKAPFGAVDREIKGLRVDKKTGKPLPDVTPDASDEEEDLLEVCHG
jgi:hypothetical protein